LISVCILLCWCAHYLPTVRVFWKSHFRVSQILEIQLCCALSNHCDRCWCRLSFCLRRLGCLPCFTSLMLQYHVSQTHSLGWYRARIINKPHKSLSHIIVKLKLLSLGGKYLGYSHRMTQYLCSPACLHIDYVLRSPLVEVTSNSVRHVLLLPGKCKSVNTMYTADETSPQWRHSCINRYWSAN
jgi:hypothetical protein